MRSVTGFLKKILRKGLPAAAALTLASCSLLPGGDPAAMVPQAPEMTVPVTRGNITAGLSFVGNLQYNQSSTLTWKTAGVIDTVSVQVGDKVKKGDILAVLETTSLDPSVILAEKTMIEQQENLEDVKDSQAARMQAYVTLNAKESALKTAKLQQEALYYPRATRAEMERAWDKLALASLNFNYAKQDYDYLVSIGEPWSGYEEGRVVKFFGRTFKIGANGKSARERKFDDYVSTYNTLVSAYEAYLWISGEPTATDYAIAEGNVQVAQMEYDKALEEYLSYEHMPREKDVHLAEVSLANAENSYKSRFITAPFDGTVTSVTAEADHYVTRGSTAMRVDDMERVFIPISIPELDVSAVENGSEVTITVDALPGKTYKGHIYTIATASTAAESTTAFSAMVEVDDPDTSMRAGMTAEVSVPANEKTNVLLIPNAAVSYHDGQPVVTIVNGDTREIVPVTLGIVSGNISEVRENGPLREGARLLVSSITPDTIRALGIEDASIQDAPQSSGTTVRQYSAPAERQTSTALETGDILFRRDPELPLEVPEKTITVEENPGQRPAEAQPAEGAISPKDPQQQPEEPAAETETAEPTGEPEESPRQGPGITGTMPAPPEGMPPMPNGGRKGPGNGTPPAFPGGQPPAPPASAGKG